VKRQERLKEIARKLWETKQAKDQIEQNRKELAADLYRLLEYDFRNKDHLLPVVTIEVPEEFFTRTGLTRQEFIDTRFPGWDVEHEEVNITTEMTTFVLKRNPRYMGGVVEVPDGDHTIRVSKTISEYTPEIDWDTLAKERPDLMKRLATPVTIYELNEDELEKLFHENPEDVPILKRHMVVREPAIKVIPRRVKDGRNTLK
jgi:hypothetical protein